MNPMQIIQMIRSGQNPQNMLIQALRQQGSNPMTENLITMIQNNDRAGLEQLARNLAQSQGKDFDKEFASFKQKMGLQ